MRRRDRTFKEDLASSPRYGLFQTLRDSQIAGLLAGAGWDFVLIDSEHFAINPETLHELVMSVQSHGLTALVRLADGERATVQRALETGCDGLLAPLCSSIDDARRFVDHALYPPRGSRGFHGLTRATGFEPTDPGGHMNRTNAELLLGVQIESRAGLENCRAIAATPGLNLLFLGTGDLSADLGQPGAGDTPELRAACKSVCDAADAAGKISGVYSSRPDFQEFARAAGASLLVTASDGALLRKASLASFAALTGPGDED